MAEFVVFGGTFDPPHVGHLVVAQCAAETLGAPVILMVAADPWQKSARRSVTPASVRFEMVAAALGKETSSLLAGEDELRRAGPTYTIDTVIGLGADATVTLLLGSDAIAGLGSWHRSEELASMCQVVCIERPGSPPPAVPAGWNVRPLRAPQIEVSSTWIRSRVAAGLPIRHLVPQEVESVIVDHGLYRGPS